LLATRTTPRRATFNALVGLGLTLVLMWLVTFAFTFLAGLLPPAHFGPGGVLLQSLSLVSAAAMFLAIAALLSQLAATAGQATMLSSAVLAIGYVVRLIGDANSSLDWVRWLSPMGWIEHLRPLQDPQFIALVPMVLLVVACSVGTVILAGRRDLNASVLRERNQGAGNSRLLGNTTAFAIRLGQTAGLIWLVAVALWVYLLGSLTRSATNIITSGSPTVLATLSRLGVRQATGGYLGLIFLLTAVVVALLSATQMVAVRDEESSGRLDNLLVRPVSRTQWLAGRLGVVVGMVLLAGVAAGAFTWIGSADQHTGVSPLKMLEAGLNVIPPALFVIGACALVFGIRPQLTAAVGYGLVAWSFLLDMVSALIRNADWLKNASLFSHMELAPAVNPDWGSNAIVVLLGLAATIVGVVAFQHRDVAYA